MEQYDNDDSIEVYYKGDPVLTVDDDETLISDIDEPIDGLLDEITTEFDQKPRLELDYQSECSTDSKTVGRTFTGDNALISAYKQFPILYNRSHADYKKNYLKEKAWRDVANKTGASVEMVKKRMTFLRCRFSVERRLAHNGQTGSEWPLLDRLGFLDKHIRMRKTASDKRSKSPAPLLIAKKEEMQFTPPYNFQANLPPPAAQETNHSSQSTQTLAERRDEYQIFGEYVGEVLRKLTNAPETTLKVMQVLVEAQKEHNITSQNNNNSISS